MRFVSVTTWVRLGSTSVLPRPSDVHEQKRHANSLETRRWPVHSCQHVVFCMCVCLVVLYLCCVCAVYLSVSISVFICVYIYVLIYVRACVYLSAFVSVFLSVPVSIFFSMCLCFHLWLSVVARASVSFLCWFLPGRVRVSVCLGGVWAWLTRWTPADLLKIEIPRHSQVLGCHSLPMPSKYRVPCMLRRGVSGSDYKTRLLKMLTCHAVKLLTSWRNWNLKLLTIHVVKLLTYHKEIETWFC